MCEIVMFQLVSRTRTPRRGRRRGDALTDRVYYLWQAHDPSNFEAKLSLPFIPILQR